jgi:hypothetical protein
MLPDETRLNRVHIPIVSYLQIVGQVIINVPTWRRVIGRR